MFESGRVGLEVWDTYCAFCFVAGTLLPASEHLVEGIRDLRGFLLCWILLQILCYSRHVASWKPEDGWFFLSSHCLVGAFPSAKKSTSL